ncbi:alkaline phosphatase family protein [uncultured Schumannella sp.]|uniref:alkaline phosphatase family protein n=1 Tax=uncultured Schumannella sp. TaxID=1195956 RepID=UPI00260057F3|nr:nucleotide pyrophosphatase/phosphodiesterase family protein [uncultured Schumannella sp.]
MTHAIVVLVDGLGAEGLTAHRGHARTLAAHLDRDPPIDSGIPSTTAAALASLMTGTRPGEHGMVGYSVLDPTSDRVVNQLTGWGPGALDPESWQRSRTVFERAHEFGIESVAIGRERYRDSGFSAAVLRGAEFRAGATIEDRVDVAMRELRRPGPRLIYLYVPELDAAGHAKGMASAEWTSALETLDAALAPLVAGLSSSQGVLVTADHGMLDIPSEAHRIVAPELLTGVRHVAGEPRGLQLHLEPGVDADTVAEAWRTHEGPRAWVATRAEAIAAGWFGPVDAEVEPRFGDVFVFARRPIAYYVDPEDGGRGMVGQHGSLTSTERSIPLLRFGAFAR